MPKDKSKEQKDKDLEALMRVFANFLIDRILESKNITSKYGNNT